MKRLFHYHFIKFSLKAGEITTLQKKWILVLLFFLFAIDILVEPNVSTIYATLAPHAVAKHPSEATGLLIKAERVRTLTTLSCTVYAPP